METRNLCRNTLSSEQTASPPTPPRPQTRGRRRPSVPARPNKARLKIIKVEAERIFVPPIDTGLCRGDGKSPGGTGREVEIKERSRWILTGSGEGRRDAVSCQGCFLIGSPVLIIGLFSCGLLKQQENAPSSLPIRTDGL